MSQKLSVLGLENDGEGAQIVYDELRLLATVQRALQVAKDAPKSTLQMGRGDEDAILLELRDDVASAKPEDLPALFEQMHTLGALRAQRGKSIMGSINLSAPYFGHLRLKEVVGGKKRTRDILIGAKSYLDPRAGIRIVDWRHAPVSRIFYRYQEGDDYDEEMGAQPIEGEVLLRRSLAIVSGELRRVSCPQGTFTCDLSGRWKRLDVQASRLFSLSKTGDKDSARLGIGANGHIREDKLLPEIAAMLDKAQYDLITQPGASLIAIQGSAGSGKTTVGLHRVAYLASIDPNRFRPEKMMVFVPNEALIHYVSRVLPNLGVDGVKTTTFDRFALRASMILFQNLPSRVSNETPAIVSKAKAHGSMLVAIDELVKQTENDISERLQSSMSKWPSGKRVVDAWRKVDADTLDTRLQALSSWLYGKREIAEMRADDLHQVTKDAALDLLADLRKVSRDVVGLWEELCTSRELLSKALSHVLSDHQLRQVIDWCTTQARIRADGERDGVEPNIDQEDYAILLRLWQRFRGPLVDQDQKPYRFAHLFVDEVQDQSPVELRVLLDLVGKDQSITLSGDVAQRMVEASDESDSFSWQKLLSELGVPAIAVEPLKVSYRSTKEITDFSRKILGELAHDVEPIASRNGPPVELFEFASPGEAVAFLADALKQLYSDEPRANVAVIARFAQQAQIYFEGLERAEVPNLRLVSKQNFTWEPGFDVTDVRQTKGLEFDEVVLLETSAVVYPTNHSARHALYVAATRAAHQLWCLTSEKPSSLVEAALER